MSTPEKSKNPRSSREIVLVLYTIAFTLLAELIVGLGIFTVTLTVQAHDAAVKSSSQSYNGNSDDSTPDVLTTMQPLVKFTAGDYPCSENLYKIRNRVQEGAVVGTTGEPEEDTTAYCKKVLKAVNALTGIDAKVNHLVVEYCKADGASSAATDPQYAAEHPNPKLQNLNDIYGSLYGSIIANYDLSADDYFETWVQRPSNGKPAYFVGSAPSLVPMANRYCPDSGPKPSAHTGTGQE